ncbi:Surface layer protein A (S-layer protein A) [Propionibacterium freudenreichii]|nr:Surface layer protein A (S-layer protein A) [Propionibacterium freudenreichii]SCQ79616.1 Surface layer protein A (S-layer protein A) [Propionibacterium freudenreichii]
MATGAAAAMFVTTFAGMAPANAKEVASTDEGYWTSADAPGSKSVVVDFTSVDKAKGIQTKCAVNLSGKDDVTRDVSQLLTDAGFSADTTAFPATTVQGLPAKAVDGEGWLAFTGEPGTKEWSQLKAAPASVTASVLGLVYGDNTGSGPAKGPAVDLSTWKTAAPVVVAGSLDKSVLRGSTAVGLDFSVTAQSSATSTDQPTKVEYKLDNGDEEGTWTAVPKAGVWDGTSAWTYKWSQANAASGIYTATYRVTNADGLVTTSKPTEQAVVAGPVAIAQQPTDVTAAPGGNAVFTVKTTGTGVDGAAVAYQWQSQDKVTGEWADVTGATKSSYTVRQVTEDQDGTLYRVVVTGADSQGKEASLYSSSAKLTVAEVPVATATFVDVPKGNEFFKEIEWLAGEGISTGWVLPDGTKEYRPLDSIHRDAMAAFMYRLAGSPAYTAPATSPFSDVATSNQFYKEISWLASTGITTGYGDGTFRPLDNVNRDAMAAFMYRFKGNPAYTAPATSPFNDVATSQQFYKEMAWLSDEGISTGWEDGTYRPVTPVARDAMAAFIYRLQGN